MLTDDSGEDSDSPSQDSDSPSKPTVEQIFDQDWLLEHYVEGPQQVWGDLEEQQQVWCFRFIFIGESAEDKEWRLINEYGRPEIQLMNEELMEHQLVWANQDLVAEHWYATQALDAAEMIQHVQVPVQVWLAMEHDCLDYHMQTTKTIDTTLATPWWTRPDSHAKFEFPVANGQIFVIPGVKKADPPAELHVALFKKMTLPNANKGVSCPHFYTSTTITSNPNPYPPMVQISSGVRMH